MAAGGFSRIYAGIGVDLYFEKTSFKIFVFGSN